MTTSDNMSDIEEKAIWKRGGGKKPYRKLRRVAKKPEFDGDDDGFITNPLTGEDNIPWNKDRETPEEAISRFFGGKPPASIGAPIGPEPKKMPKVFERPLATTSGQRLQRTPTPLAAAKPAAPVPTPPPAPATPRDWKWPVGDNGKVLPAADLDDDQLLRLANIWLPDDSSAGASVTDKTALESLKQTLRDEVTKRGLDKAVEASLAGDQNALRQALSERQRIENQGDQALHRSQMWDKFREWIPDARWRGQGKSRQSWMGEDVVAYDRLNTERSRLEVVDALEHQMDQEGFIVIGRYWDTNEDEWREYDPFGDEIVHDTVEDAMKWAEEFNEQLENDWDANPDDDNFATPEVNQLSDRSSTPTTNKWRVFKSGNKPAVGKTGALGDVARAHNWISRHLESARDLFAEKWMDRRSNRNIAGNIEFAEDRIGDLQRLHDRMWRDYMTEFPGLEQAYNMTPSDFARYAFTEGIVDSLMEGRKYHEELLDAWDQLAADQQEIVNMIDEVGQERDKFIAKWNQRAEERLASPKGPDDAFPGRWEDR